MPDEHKHELPQPRLEIIDEIFEKIDELLVSEANKYKLSHIEVEILMLYLRKKVEYNSIVDIVNHTSSTDMPNVNFKGTNIFN